MAGEKEGGEGTKKDELLLQSLSPFPLFLFPIQVLSPFHLPRGNALAKTGYMNSLQ